MDYATVSAGHEKIDLYKEVNELKSTINSLQKQINKNEIFEIAAKGYECKEKEKEKPIEIVIPVRLDAKDAEKQLEKLIEQVKKLKKALNEL